MHETRLVAAHMFGQMRQERDDVVFGDRFDLVNAGDVEFNVLGLPDRIGVFARDHTQIGHRIAGMCLDLVPDLELGCWFPDRNHIGTGITGDHGRTFS